MEDSIRNYITICPEIFKPIKIGHLISQSACLPNSTNYSFPGEQITAEANAEKPFGNGKQ